MRPSLKEDERFLAEAVLDRAADVEKLISERSTEFPDLDDLTVKACEVFNDLESGDRVDAPLSAGAGRSLPDDAAVHDTLGQRDQLRVGAVDHRRRPDGLEPRR